MTKVRHSLDRCQFIGGSDARTIMGKDEKALHRLWREKRVRWHLSTCRAS